jgi:hypothetical protein
MSTGRTHHHLNVDLDMRTLLLCVLSLALLAADPPDKDQPKQPPEIQKAMAVYEKALADAHKAFDVAEAQARSVATKALDKIKLDDTKKGDLDAANQIVATIKKLNEGKGGPAANADAPDAAKLLLSRWYLESGGNVSGFNVAKIQFDGKVVTPSTGFKRGLNVAIVTGNKAKSQNYDFYADKEAPDRFVKDVKALPVGTVVAVALCDTAAEGFSPDVADALASIGGTTNLRVKNRMSYILIGYKGISSGAVEQCSEQYIKFDGAKKP